MHVDVMHAAVAAKTLQSCPTLYDPIDGNPPGSAVPGILQARTLEWVAISLSNTYMHPKSLQSCPTLCDPIDGNPPGSSVHGIHQARILEWVAVYGVIKSRTRLKCLSSNSSMHNIYMHINIYTLGMSNMNFNK